MRRRFHLAEKDKCRDFILIQFPSGMHVNDTDDPKTYLTELKQHFERMTKRYENLVQMGSTTSDTRFATMVMSSLPPSY